MVAVDSQPALAEEGMKTLIPTLLPPTTSPAFEAFVPAFMKLQRLSLERDTLLCVGIDPSPALLQNFAAGKGWKIKSENDGKSNAGSNVGNNLKTLSETAAAYCSAIVDATHDLVCAYKPNSAFFEALGPQGMAVLEEVCANIHRLKIPIILDFKRGDIGSTARAYAQAAYRVYKADIVTVNPYMGVDSLIPYVDGYPDKAIFVLCKTSNPGAENLQSRTLVPTDEGKPGIALYEAVVDMCDRSNLLKLISGFVIGATQPEALKKVRSTSTKWILAPGIGAQSGDLEACLEAGLLEDGSGIVIPISRAIIAADVSPETGDLFDNIGLR